MKGFKKIFVFVFFFLFAVNAYASNDSKSKALAKQPVVEQKNASQSVPSDSKVNSQKDIITIVTSCGVHVWVPSSAFNNAFEVVEFALMVDDFFCGAL